MADYNSSLPVRTQANGDVAVFLADGTTPSQVASVDTFGSQASIIKDASGNAVTTQANGTQRALDVGINVAGVQVDPRNIRALTSADVVSANIRDNTGTAFSASNPLPVSLSSSNAGTEINDYNTAAALAAAGVSNHDYTVTALKTLLLSQIWASASAKLKIEVQIETGVATGVFTSKFVGFNSTSNPNIPVPLSQPISVAAGVRVRVIRTNKDNQAQDVYSTICGSEV